MIVLLHPDVLYLVAGQTHPEVVKKEGERYRLSLERLVRDCGLERKVRFLDRFLPAEELAFLLSSTDIYLAPTGPRADRFERTDTRGGRWLSRGVDDLFYAEDLLASGAGILVDFEYPAAFAKGLLQYLDHPDELSAAPARRRGAWVRG